jgi:flagellin-like protein
MRRSGRWRHAPRRGVSNIIAVILLLGITVAAGAILWGFSLHLQTAAPTITVTIRAGTSNPVWGDPTDCLPWFPAWLNYNTQVTTVSTSTTADYLLSGSTYSINPKTTWGTWWFHGLSNISGGTSGRTLSNQECSSLAPPGDFSGMNTTQFIVSSHTPSALSLSNVGLLFLCNGTAFVNGSLASMTWYPGSSTGPAPNAPHLGKCGTFIPSGSFSTLYNRFGIFVPLNENTSILQDGDTFVMYVHTSSPFDPDTAGGNVNQGTGRDCGPGPDCDDYHGAPPWCFTVPVTPTTGCTLDFYYIGTPSSLLFSIPLYNIIRG